MITPLPQGTNPGELKAKFKSLSVESTVSRLTWNLYSSRLVHKWRAAAVGNAIQILALTPTPPACSLNGTLLPVMTYSTTMGVCWIMRCWRTECTRNFKKSDNASTMMVALVYIVLLIVYQNEIPSPGIHPLKFNFCHLRTPDTEG